MMIAMIPLRLEIYSFHLQVHWLTDFLRVQPKPNKKYRQAGNKSPQKCLALFLPVRIALSTDQFVFAAESSLHYFFKKSF